MQKIIFTDLDGTFLNHDDYTFDQASDALSYLKQEKIPLIFTTSKTKKEVEKLQKEVGIAEPFIVENGAALFVPLDYGGIATSDLERHDDYHVVVFGTPISEILDFYERYKEAFGMVGFSQMSVQEVASLTQMDEARARLAKMRDFTEPFLLKDESVLPSLMEKAAEHGIKVTKGGRFYHLIGEAQDKGIAVNRTIALFEVTLDAKVESLGLGDSLNDLPMLKEVSIPIVIQQHDGGYLHSETLQLYKSSFPGSKGWNEMVLKYVT